MTPKKDADEVTPKEEVTIQSGENLPKKDADEDIQLRIKKVLGHRNSRVVLSVRTNGDGVREGEEGPPIVHRNDDSHRPSEGDPKLWFDEEKRADLAVV